MIKELQKRIATAAWNLNFHQFCERAGFDPRHRHAEEKWFQWRALADSLNAFDAETLKKIITDPTTPPTDAAVAAAQAVEKFSEAAQAQLAGNFTDARQLFAQAKQLYERFEEQTAPLIKPQPKDSHRIGGFEV